MTRRSYTSGKRDRTNAPALDFELDGVTFASAGGVSVLDLSEYARLAAQGVDAESQEGLAILADVYLGLLGEQVYQRFRAHCRRHQTDPAVLVQILGDLISEAADRPTSRPADSSDGPPTVPGTATVVSFSRGTVEQEVPREASQVVSYG
jgi:hypothetical protein